MKRNLLTLCLLAIGFVGYGQGVTTASMNGRITDSTGQPLPGATIVAVHAPTGSQYGNISDADGYYRIPNMNVGGPYTITISFVGYEDYKKSGIHLSLGQKYKLSQTMSESMSELAEIVITADEIFDGNRTGAETNLNTEAILAVPTVGRSLGDFARFEPTARISEGNDGFEISIAGMNNRLNAIYIDGAVNNDVFGLAGSGTNGGQTGVSPYPIDAIAQFNISVAPFDIRQSGFAGGSINAVTRSGTNEFSGSAYYFFRNQNMTGLTPAEDFDGVDREKLADYSANTYGVRVGGPIVKDKVFFFFNAEIQKDETPQPFDVNNYTGDATAADISALTTKIGSYGYDPGTYLNNTAFLNSNKFIGKLDFNLGKNHKLTVRHSYVESENLEARRSSTSSLQFANGSEYFISKTNSTAIELKSNFDKMSNHLVIGRTAVRDDRDPQGDAFPSVTIIDGNGRIVFGAEPFSTANLLNQDITTITNNFEIYKGKHTFLIGANLEFNKTLNLFIPFNYGSYEFNNVNDFVTDQPSWVYQRGYSKLAATVGNESPSGVEFTSQLLGLYLQDEYNVNDKLKVTLGLRVDMQLFQDTPENVDFNTNTIPAIEAAGYDLKGAKTGEFIKPQAMFAPRISFNYDLKGDQTTQLRGGLGIFTSRVPLVWPGGAYNNNGINQGFEFQGGWFMTPEVFNPDVNNQAPDASPYPNTSPSGNIDLFASEFKIPQVFKTNLAIDQKLPGGIIASFDAIYTKFINNIYYENVNLNPSYANLDQPTDQRPLFDRGDEVDGNYGRISLASNTSKGYAYNFSLLLRKNFDSGVNTSLSYSYGDSYSIYDGTSSQNSSQWRYNQTVSDRNVITDARRSQFAAGNRVLGTIGYRKEYANHLATQVSLVYEGRSGNPYSFLIGDGDDMVNADSRTPELAYIPKNAGDINMPAADYAALDAFISQDKYLSSIRGQYVDRYQNRTPWENIFDLKFLQDFYITTGEGKKNALQVSLDILNIGNLLNKAWGKQYRRGDSRFNYALYRFEGFVQDGGGNDTAEPTYSFTAFEEDKPYYNNLDDSGLRSSRWQMQVGIRYIFN
jgi:carboxypeptidase family protein